MRWWPLRALHVMELCCCRCVCVCKWWALWLMQYQPPVWQRTQLRKMMKLGQTRGRVPGTSLHSTFHLSVVHLSYFKLKCLKNYFRGTEILACVSQMPWREVWSPAVLSSSCHSPVTVDIFGVHPTSLFCFIAYFPSPPCLPWPVSQTQVSNWCQDPLDRGKSPCGGRGQSGELWDMLYSVTHCPAHCEEVLTLCPGWTRWK